MNAQEHKEYLKEFSELTKKILKSASLDGIPLTNEKTSLTLPFTTGFKIASYTSQSNGLSGLVDNILLSALKTPIAQYSLNTGSGSIAFDSVNHCNGSITNGIWQSHVIQ